MVSIFLVRILILFKVRRSFNNNWITFGASGLGIPFIQYIDNYLH